MSKNINFEVGTIVTDTFLDSIQELLTGSMFNLRLAEYATAADRLTLKKDGDLLYDAEGSINIAGRYCNITSDKDSTPASGGPGAKRIYLSTTANNTPQQPDFDITVSNTPPVASYIRNLGTADLTGGALTNVRLKNGLQIDADQYNAFTFRSVRDISTETFLTLEGQNNQTSPITFISTALTPDPSTSPTRALSVGFDTVGVYGERLYIDTRGRLVWTEGVTDLSLGWIDNDVLGTNTEFSSRPDGPNVTAFSTLRSDTHTQNAFTISNSGELCWGDGLSPVDVCLGRTAPDEISLDTGDKIFMDYTILAGDSDDILTNKEYVDTVVTAAISESKRFAFFITP